MATPDKQSPQAKKDADRRRPDPNVVQRQASDPTASVWVSASAGTGKTKVLTDRTLRLMLNGAKPDQILAITFTRAAASVMTNRIRDELSNWATCDEDFNVKYDPLHKVTIIPRGRALGVTMQLPEGDRYSMDKGRMLSTISVLFGGRIAEEVFMDQMTTGASNDFERATQIARDMVTRYGMTDALGPMVYADNEGEVFLGRSVTKTTNMSEQTMQKVDREIRRIIDEQYALARRLIEENQSRMHVMAKALLDWETIDSDQIDDIMSDRPPRPPKDWVPSANKTPGGPSNPSVNSGNAAAAAS